MPVCWHANCNRPRRAANRASAAPFVAQFAESASAILAPQSSPRDVTSRSDPVPLKEPPDSGTGLESAKRILLRPFVPPAIDMMPGATLIEATRAQSISRAYERATIDFFERSRNSVVFITTKQSVVDFWSRNVMSVPRGAGAPVWGPCPSAADCLVVDGVQVEHGRGGGRGHQITRVETVSRLDFRRQCTDRGTIGGSEIACRRHRMRRSPRT